jgi:hypothetical protein
VLADQEASGSQPTTSLTAAEAQLNPFLALAEAQRGSAVGSASFVPTDVVGFAALDGVASNSTVATVRDSIGTYTLSLNPVPNHQPYAVLRVTDGQGGVSWLVDTTTAKVVQSNGSQFSTGPVVTKVPPSALSMTLSSPSASKSTSPRTSTSVSGFNAAPRNSLAAAPDVLDICTLLAYEVDVIGSPFGPLLDGYTTETCEYPTSISLLGQIQILKNSSWQFIGTLQEAPVVTGLEQTLTVYEPCHVISGTNPFRLFASVVAEFDGHIATGQEYSASKNNACFTVPGTT